MPSGNPGTVVFESGLASPPVVWQQVAQLVAPEFRVVVHRRAETGGALPKLAQEWHDALRKGSIAPPYLLVAHSFGALTARQFAVLYPQETSGIVFVDGLPTTAEVPAGRIGRGIAMARVAQIAAFLGVTGPVLAWAKRHVQAVQWAIAELAKLPRADQQLVVADWHRPGFYAGLAGTLRWLRLNLRIARGLKLPPTLPTISLHSDYADLDGQRVENSGHWIQVDQPDCVASAIREVAAQAWHNQGSKGV